MTKYFCDRCKKEVNAKYDLYEIKASKRVMQESYSLIFIKEVCHDCLDGVDQFIINPELDRPDEQERNLDP